ncbi:MAG: PAS domain S-box protein, partial [Acidobacteriaceae bacterium]|nr:PAS domain S-box protein [Acidobacteriaceae bacterium]
RNLFEMTADGILIVDDQGRYVDVNESFCKFLKTSRQKLIGTHFSEFIPPDRLDDAVKAFADLRHGHATPVEFPLRAADGSIIDLEWSSYCHVVHNLSFCVCRNLTDARRTQAALQIAEERQRRAVEAGGVGLWEWDARKNHLLWSDQTYRLFGLDPGSFAATAEAFTELVDPRDRERVTQALEAALNGKSDYQVEYRTLRPDGKTIWIHSSGKVSTDADGRPLTVRGAAIEITERKQAEEAQRQTEQQLMLLIEASSALLASPHSTDVLKTIVELAQRFVSADGHAAWRKDSSHQWRLASYAGLSADFIRSGLIAEAEDSAPILREPLVIVDVATESLLNARREALLHEGIRSMLIIPLWVHGRTAGTVAFYSKSPHIFDESEVRIASALGNLAASALSTAELYERQLELREAAQVAERRSAFLAEAGALLSSSLDYDSTLKSVANLAIPLFADWASVELVADDGKLRRIAVVHRDPHKLRLASEFAKRFAPREDDLSSMALRTGKSFLIEEVSEELILQRARDAEHASLLQQLGLKSIIVVPMLAGARSLGIITFVTAESGRVYSQTDLQTAEELARRASVALEHARLYKQSQEDQGELKLRNQELRRANDDLNQFAYSASHDLQEPLRMVQAYSQLLQRRYGSQLDDTARSYIEYAVEGARRLEALLRDMLIYTQAASVQDKDCGSVDANEVLQKALANLESAVSEAQAEIVTAELPRIKMQEVHLLQLFQNLLGNALKYRAAGQPRITVSVEPQGPSWLFSIKDNGIGIAPEYQRQIFGLFKRLHSAEAYPGTGVGLALCQKIVERYGGEIWVESAVGNGSTFFFTLPAEKSANREAIPNSA